MTIAVDRDLPLVGLLDAVVDHLVGFELPEPYGLQARTHPVGHGAAMSVQLAECGLPAVAAALVLWADTLSAVSLSVWRPPSSDAVHVQVSGRLAGGVPIEVWAGVAAPVPLVSLDPGQKRTLRLGLLRTWTVAGAQEQAGGAA